MRGSSRTCRTGGTECFTGEGILDVRCSVPQGSVLGPLLFLLCTAELAELAAGYGATLHAFADDNQLYLHCRIDDVHSSA